MSKADRVKKRTRQFAPRDLGDNILFRLNDADFDAFLEALENPGPRDDKLIALMRRVPIWER